MELFHISSIIFVIVIFLQALSLAPQHLSSKPADNVGFDEIYAHIEHYLSLGGENTVCLGCDFDGISACPAGISDISDLYSFAEYLQKKNYSDSLINRIFYKNAFDKFKSNLS